MVRGVGERVLKSAALVYCSTPSVSVRACVRAWVRASVQACVHICVYVC